VTRKRREKRTENPLLSDGKTRRYPLGLAAYGGVGRICTLPLASCTGRNHLHIRESRLMCMRDSTVLDRVSFIHTPAAVPAAWLA